MAYIPQTIYLIDDTIRANVGFGLPRDQISDDDVWNALRSARLDDFVKSLPQGLETEVGERGIRLSGGAASADRDRPCLVREAADSRDG